MSGGSRTQSIEAMVTQIHRGQRRAAGLDPKRSFGAGRTSQIPGISVASLVAYVKVRRILSIEADRNHDAKEAGNFRPGRILQTVNRQGSLA